jgi:hypothetical protein
MTRIAARNALIFGRNCIFLLGSEWMATLRRESDLTCRNRAINIRIGWDSAYSYENKGNKSMIFIAILGGSLIALGFGLRARLVTKKKQIGCGKGLPLLCKNYPYG